MQLLFWMPSLVDLILFVMTFSLFYTKGPAFFFSTGWEDRRVIVGDLNSEANRVINQVWDGLLIAYATYGVLLLLYIFWAGFIDPSMRIAFCTAMAILMFCKDALVKKVVDHAEEDNVELKSFFFFDLPCCLGYVLYSLFK